MNATHCNMALRPKRRRMRGAEDAADNGDDDGGVMDLVPATKRMCLNLSAPLVPPLSLPWSCDSMRDLPIDVLAQITDMLPLEAVARCWETGDAQLRLKLSHGGLPRARGNCSAIRSLRDRIAPGFLKRLEICDGAIVLSALQASMRTVATLTPFAATLCVLEMDCMRMPVQWVDIVRSGIRFPLLETLRMALPLYQWSAAELPVGGFRRSVNHTVVTTLCPALRSLCLTSDVLNSDHIVLCALPPALTALRLCTVSRVHIHPEDMVRPAAGALPFFPRTLRSLVADEPGRIPDVFTFLAQLPPSLLTLSCRICPHIRPYAPPVKDTSCFFARHFPDLESLTLVYSARIHADQVASSLIAAPASLCDLTVRWSVRYCQEEAIPLFEALQQTAALNRDYGGAAQPWAVSQNPRAAPAVSLPHLVALICDMPPETLLWMGAWFPLLRVLDMRFPLRKAGAPPRQWTTVHAAQLPSRLEHLALTGVVMLRIESLPPTLQRLMLDGRFELGSRALCGLVHLRTLKLDGLDGQFPALIPHDLVVRAVDPGVAAMGDLGRALFSEREGCLVPLRGMPHLRHVTVILKVSPEDPSSRPWTSDEMRRIDWCLSYAIDFPRFLALLPSSVVQLDFGTFTRIAMNRHHLELMLPLSLRMFNMRDNHGSAWWRPDDDRGCDPDRWTFCPSEPAVVMEDSEYVGPLKVVAQSDDDDDAHMIVD